MNTKKVKNILIIALVSLFASCKDDNTLNIQQPDFIATSLSANLAIESGQEFELFVPDNEEGVVYIWTIPDMLGMLEGQGTNRIKVIPTIEGGVIPQKSIGVVAKRGNTESYTRWLYKDITILIPPPTLENYRTKRYGTKTWMIENLNEAGTMGNLGRMYDNDPDKAAIYGRLYSWHEAMTGIPNATAAQNPYAWGSSGTDDAGNPYTVDGTYANLYNIQVQGACPKGWHVPNMNDWYDLIAAIKDEYGIPGSTLGDVANTKDGYIMGAARNVGILNSLALTTWGVVSPYLKGSSPISANGLWSGGTTFPYGGNATFPGGEYPLYKDLSSTIEFNILPSGRRTAAGVFNDEGIYSYHWVAYRGTANSNNPMRVTVASGNANFSNGFHDPLDSFCLRCVANY
ncbi:hypothetical protein G5B00_12380 [Parapedobacter sp. SGR-10]|uniref:FISUMP domain-containing protein n=1 Tax=Parapedobacter sp. SGR-10 TaxID=2710879 RepID=UPI0013D0EDAC|nr:FISUMP domain-containing protein [Parapedobacter sp. SGR-10]NGF57307.1 hypothetical protein [Parapedobacter sp. SGR-10]